VPAENRWLSEREAGVLSRLRVPKRRADWRLGRWTAKNAVAARLGLPRDDSALASIEAIPALSGAPEVYIGGERARLSLSISHSHGVGFCAVARTWMELGCDVEAVEPHSEAFFEDYFNWDEQEAIGRCPVPERNLMMTLLWSAKESALKALRVGLRLDTRSITAVPLDFPAMGGGPWYSLAATGVRGKCFQGWWRVTGDMVWTLLAVSGSHLLLTEARL